MESRSRGRRRLCCSPPCRGGPRGPGRGRLEEIFAGVRRGNDEDEDDTKGSSGSETSSVGGSAGQDPNMIRGTTFIKERQRAASCKCTANGPSLWEKNRTTFIFYFAPCPDNRRRLVAAVFEQEPPPPPSSSSNHICPRRPDHTVKTKRAQTARTTDP